MPPLINLEQDNNQQGESFSDYRDMFMYNPTLMWIFDLETLKFLEVNNAALKHYGYSREEFLSMRITDIRPEEDVAALLNDIQSTIDKVNFAGEWRHRKRNGEITVMNIISYPFVFNGRAARHVMATDVTDKKRIERSLRISEQRFRTIVEGSPDPIIIQINNKFVYLNPKALELFKPKDEMDLIGKDVLSIVHPDYKEMVSERINQVWAEGLPVTTPDEIKLLALDGSEIWVETAEQPVEYMGQKANVVFFRDITERKNSAEAMKYQEDLLQEMGRLAQVGGWEFDPNTGKGTWTDEVARIHGLDPNDPTSKDIGLNFYAKESRARVEKAINEALEKRIPYNLELEIILNDGTHKWVQTYGQPIIENDRIVKLRGSFQDITQRKINEKALIESESKYRAFFENSLDAMMLTSPEGAIIQANHSACQLFGYSEAELK
jgi:PAS domain S-box-containing protein